MLKYILAGLLLAIPLFWLNEIAGLVVGAVVGLLLYGRATCAQCHQELGLFAPVCPHCGRDRASGKVRTDS